jgi:hypothetical protein
MHGFTDGTGWAMQGNSDGAVTFFFGNGMGPAPQNFIGVGTPFSMLDVHWHHLVGVYTGFQLQMFLDGVLQKSITTAVVPAGNNRDIELGRSWGGGSPTRYFNGLLDEVSYYDRALSAAEVLGLYNAGPAGKTLSSLAPIQLSATAQPDAVVLSFSAIPGKTYTLEYETSLTGSNWIDLYTVTAANPTVSHTNALSGSPQGFFRVRTTRN